MKIPFTFKVTTYAALIKLILSDSHFTCQKAQCDSNSSSGSLWNEGYKYWPLLSQMQASVASFPVASANVQLCTTKFRALPIPLRDMHQTREIQPKRNSV